MAPPVVLFSLSGTCTQQVHYRDLMGAPGEKPQEAPKNFHPTVPKTGSKIDPKRVDGYAFFHVHCSIKSQENFKTSKSLNS